MAGKIAGSWRAALLVIGGLAMAHGASAAAILPKIQHWGKISSRGQHKSKRSRKRVRFWVFLFSWLVFW
jgi:predicted MFS family arabinose efflux permease